MGFFSVFFLQKSLVQTVWICRRSLNKIISSRISGSDILFMSSVNNNSNWTMALVIMLSWCQKTPQKTRLPADASRLLQHKQVAPRTQQEQLRVPQCRGAAAGPIGRAGGCCWAKKKKRKKKMTLGLLSWPCCHGHTLIKVWFLLFYYQQKQEEMRRK